MAWLNGSNFLPNTYNDTEAPLLNQQQYAEKAYELIRRDILPTAPGDVIVSYGFPKGRSAKVGAHSVGECFTNITWTTDPKKAAVIFIRPSEWTSPIKVLDTLTHELVHAATPGEGHKGKFTAVCKHIGLTAGKPKSASAGPELIARLNNIARELGDFPAAAFDFEHTKKQTTRLRLYQCACDPKEAKEEGRSTKIRCASDSMDMTCNICEAKFEIKEEKSE